MQALSSHSVNSFSLNKNRPCLKNLNDCFIETKKHQTKIFLLYILSKDLGFQHLIFDESKKICYVCQTLIW